MMKYGETFTTATRHLPSVAVKSIKTYKGIKVLTTLMGRLSLNVAGKMVMDGGLKSVSLDS